MSEAHVHNNATSTNYKGCNIFSMFDATNQGAWGKHWKFISSTHLYSSSYSSSVPLADENLNMWRPSGSLSKKFSSSLGSSLRIQDSGTCSSFHFVLLRVPIKGWIKVVSPKIGSCNASDLKSTIALHTNLYVTAKGIPLVMRYKVRISMKKNRTRKLKS